MGGVIIMLDCEVFNSISKFIEMQKNASEQDTTDIYNAWVTSTFRQIEKLDDVIFLLKFIDDMKYLNHIPR